MDTDVSRQGQGPQSQETLPRKESLETETSCQKRVIRSQELSERVSCLGGERRANTVGLETARLTTAGNRGEQN